MEWIANDLDTNTKNNPFLDEIRKGFQCHTDTDGCVFKKCCKKYKQGKRCKKCPKR